MKIVVVTYCLGYNYGAMLQAFATVKILEAMGHEVLLLNQHQPWSFGVDERCLRNYISFRPKAMFHKWRTLLHQQKLKTKFRPMWKMFPLTYYYGSDVNFLISNPPECDCLMTGSDQTWNTGSSQDNYAAYFLPFGSEHTRRIAFSPSLGGVRFREEDKEWILHQIQRYSAISVREKEDVMYLESLGINNVTQLPDPTLVANKDIYLQLATGESHHKYDAVVYILGGKDCHSEEKITSLLLNADCNMSNVLNIRLHNFHCKKAINMVTTVPEWVDAIIHAKIVVTNSFHAVVFSLLFKRPFVYVKFPIDEDSKNNRVRTLLQGTTQEFRMIDRDKLSNLQQFQTQPDFCNEISEMREKALDFLKNALS